MILDNIKNIRKYSSLHPGFKKAIDFITNKNNRKDGRFELSKKDYTMVSTNKGRGLAKAKLEAHRKYIDIQYVISGKEVIGYSLLRDCRKVLQKYSKEKDVAFFKDKPQCDLLLSAGDFVIFFPHDAHAPLAGKGKVRKIVAKIAV